MHSSYRYASDDFNSRPLVHSTAPQLDIDLYALLVAPLFRLLRPSSIRTAFRERIVEPLQDKWNYFQSRIRARRKQRLLLSFNRRLLSQSDLESGIVPSERTQLLASSDILGGMEDSKERISSYATFTTRSVLKRNHPISIHRGVARSNRKSVRFAGADVRTFIPQSYEQWDRRSLIAKVRFPSSSSSSFDISCDICAQNPDKHFFSSSPSALQPPQIHHKSTHGREPWNLDGSLITTPSSTPFGSYSYSQLSGHDGQWRDISF